MNMANRVEYRVKPAVSAGATRAPKITPGTHVCHHCKRKIPGHPVTFWGEGETKHYHPVHAEHHRSAATITAGDIEAAEDSGTSPAVEAQRRQAKEAYEAAHAAALAYSPRKHTAKDYKRLQEALRKAKAKYDAVVYDAAETSR